MEKFSKIVLIQESDKFSSDFLDIKEGLLKMIEESVNSTDIDVITEFIDAYLEEDGETVIKKLTSDSDIYEFYLKYTESIDEVLNTGNFFDVAPTNHNVVGLYDYLVFGTKRAIINVINRIKKELSN